MYTVCRCQNEERRPGHDGGTGGSGGGLRQVQAGEKETWKESGWLVKKKTQEQTRY